jgi:hypothetical protein
VSGQTPKPVSGCGEPSGEDVRGPAGQSRATHRSVVIARVRETARAAFGPGDASRCESPEPSRRARCLGGRRGVEPPVEARRSNARYPSRANIRTKRQRAHRVTSGWTASSARRKAPSVLRSTSRDSRPCVPRATGASSTPKRGWGAYPVVSVLMGIRRKGAPAIDIHRHQGEFFFAPIATVCPAQSGAVTAKR